MRIAKEFQKNVFCLEGDWDKDLRNKSSISAALDFLKINFNIEYIHKNCGTVDNIKYYLSLWKNKQYKDYSICYFAFHGKPERIEVGVDDFITLSDLGDMLKGACTNKIIHFGSCNTLDTDAKNIQDFLEKTKALCVCGFKTDIDFLESSVFDMLLIARLQEYKDIGALHKYLLKSHRKQIRNLDFRIHYN